MAACARSPSAIRINITSDAFTIGQDVDTVAFTVSDTDGHQAGGVYALSGTWPQSIVILPFDNGRPASSVTVEVQALLGAVKRADQFINTGFVAGHTRDESITLTATECVPMCGFGETCEGGTCTMADAGMADAGTPDFGVSDMNIVDFGPDSAPVDMTVSDGCVPSTEVCNGTDDDCDGHADEGIACVGNVLLSEVCIGTKSGGASDEFVELYNPTAYEISIAGLAIQYLSATGSAWQARGAAPMGAVLRAHGYYLFASASYAQPITPDVANAWTSGLAQTGGHVRVLFGTQELDRFGWGAAAMAANNDPAPVLDLTVVSQSYERKANATSTPTSMESGGSDEHLGNSYTSADSANDFLVRTPPDPQNSSSAIEVP